MGSIKNKHEKAENLDIIFYNNKYADMINETSYF